MRYQAKVTTRLTIGFSGNQLRWLQHEAERRGIPLAEVVRRVIDEVRGDYFVQPKNDPGATLGRVGRVRRRGPTTG